METHSTSGTNRLERFADWGPVSQRLYERGRDGEGVESQPFYYGAAVAERTRVVRKAIGYVRSNWQNYGMMMEGLKILLGKRLGDPLPTGDAGELDNLLSSSKEWKDRLGEAIIGDESDYSAIRLYASNFGHRVFKIANTILRLTNTSGSEEEQELNTAVFLVELLNIDLYNYVSLAPEVDNFQGVVFRALPASNEQLESFKELATRPIQERYWAVPLALFSASRSHKMAISFAKDKLQGQAEGHMFLWRIHIVELEAELLQLYRERFPSSMVSTICAVPIQELSQFPEEEEVVLRGPFFQLVRMQEEVIDGVGSVQVMDSVMLTINRDHPSTMELGQSEGDRARDLMTCLVGIGRAKACKNLAGSYGISDEVPLYEQLIEEEEERLKSIAFE